MNQKEFLQKIKATVHQKDGDASVILFGSRARGDYKPDSDWDILVLTKDEAGHQFQRDLRDDIYALELEYNQAISTIIVNKETWEDWEILSLYEDVAKEGIAI